MSDTAHTEPTTPTAGYVPAARTPAEPQAPPQATSRLPGVAAGITMLVGFWTFMLVPGGGTTKAADVLDYYNSGSQRGWAFVLGVVLVAACLLTMWFFSEMRQRLADTSATRVGYIFAIVGSAMLAGGVTIALGPSGVQTFSELPFAGVPVAVAMAQGGLGMAIVAGIYPLAAALVLFGLAARRQNAAMPGWLAVTTVVVGVLLLGSIVGLPAVLLPLWLILVGVVGLQARA